MEKDVLQLTDEEIGIVRANLIVIESQFIPTDERPEVDTFYLVSTYNRQNPGKEINGDTAEYIMKNL